jgi:hypothetical protein
MIYQDFIIYITLTCMKKFPDRTHFSPSSLSRRRFFHFENSTNDDSWCLEQICSFSDLYGEDTLKTQLCYTHIPSKSQPWLSTSLATMITNACMHTHKIWNNGKQGNGPPKPACEISWWGLWCCEWSPAGTGQHHNVTMPSTHMGHHTWQLHRSSLFVGPHKDTSR